MSNVVVRPFRRSDRDQVAALVDAHAAAVVPGASIPVQQVLAQLEREPGEFVVDPWVVQRMTLVAEQRGRIVAAAHLTRYGDGDDVGEGYRGAGEIRWVLFWPSAPFWPDAERAADRLLHAAVTALDGSTRIGADGTLPTPGVYGIPEQWPHIRALLARAGFTPGERTETVYLADVGGLARPAEPIAGLRTARSLGSCGTRLTASVEGERVGYVEVEVLTAQLSHTASSGGYADVGNLFVEPAYRRHGVGRWLLGAAADWLHLAHADRLLDYTSDPAYAAFLEATGFVRLTTTIREWTLETTLINADLPSDVAARRR